MRKKPIKVLLASEPNQDAETVAKRLASSRSPRFEVEIKACSEESLASASSDPSQVVLVSQHNAHPAPTDDRERRVNSLAAVAAITTKASGPEELCNALAQMMRETFTCDAFFVLRYDVKLERLLDVCKCDTINGTFQTVPNCTEAFPLEGIFVQAFKKRRTIVLHRESPSQTGEGFQPFGDKERLSASLMVCPMIAENRLMGFLSVQSYTPKAYNQRDVDLFTAVGEHVGLAFETALLNHEVRRRLASEHLFSKQLAALLDVTNQLSMASSFDTLCRRAVELGREHLKFDRLGLWFFDQEGRSIRGSFGIDEAGRIRDERSQISQMATDSPINRMITGQERFLTEKDVSLCDHLGNGVGTGDVSIAAIHDGRRVIGCISHDNLLSRDRISEHDNDLLQLYASALGSLCSLKRSEQELRESHADLEKRVQERTTKLLKANEELQFEIEERKRTEHMLRDSERRYRTLQANIPIGVFRMTLPGRIIAANPPLARLFGCRSEEELSEQSMLEYYRRPEQHREIIERLEQSHQDIGFELELRRKDWTTWWAAVTVSAFRDARGTIVYIDGTMQDITQLKRVEDALREQIERNELILHRSMDGFLLMNVNGKILDTNPAFARIVGHPRQELMGRNILDIEDPEEALKFREKLGEIHSRGSERFETRFAHRSGQVVDVEVSANLAEIGKEEFVFCFTRDISERKKVEEEIQHRLSIEKALARTSALFVASAEVDLSNVLAILGGALQVTRAFVLLVSEKDGGSYSAAEWRDSVDCPSGCSVLGSAILESSDFVERLRRDENLIISDVLDLDSRQEQQRDILIGENVGALLGVPILRSERQLAGLIGVTSREAPRFWSEADAQALRVVGEMLFRYVERLQADAALRESEEKYRLLVENVNDGIVIGQGDRFVFINRRFAEMLGYEPEELLMKDFRKVYTPFAVERLWTRRQRRDLGEPVPERYETVFRRKDGTEMDVETSVSIIDYKGELATFGVVRDITERKNTERELRSHQRELEQLTRELAGARDRALAASRAKSAFLANMSHELRTPLNAIIGFCRIVIRKTQDFIPEQQIQNLQRVLVSANHLLTLINDILDLSKIEAKRMVVNIDFFDMPLLVRETFETLHNLMESNRNRLVLNITENLPPLRSDRTKVWQILLNLFGNAAKFTQDGTITVSVWTTLQSGSDRIEDTVACHDKIVVQVQDTGIGLSEEHLRHIFEEFWQVDDSATRQHGGTGLGLAVSRRLAHLLGGSISAESQLGKGARFTLTLPLTISTHSVENEYL